MWVEGGESRTPRTVQGLGWGFRTWRIMCFAACTANGAFAVIFFAISMAFPITSFGATTWLTRPISCKHKQPVNIGPHTTGTHMTWSVCRRQF